MKRLLLSIYVLLIPLLAFAIKPEFIEWSQEEMDYANTAKDAPLSNDCKLVYLYCNLARMNGEKFAKTYLDRYVPQMPWQPGFYYLNSLYEDLKDVKGLQRLQYSNGLCDAANYHSVDMGSTGKTGHDSSDGTDFSIRVRRYSNIGYNGENCSYGYASALGIVLQLLIDDNVESLGHRKNILNPKYNYMGVSIASHKIYYHNCVMDFGAGKEEFVSMPESKPVPDYQSYKPKSTDQYERYRRDPKSCWMANGSANPDYEELVASTEAQQKKMLSYQKSTVPTNSLNNKGYNSSNNASASSQNHTVLKQNANTTAISQRSQYTANQTSSQSSAQASAQTYAQRRNSDNAAAARIVQAPTLSRPIYQPVVIIVTNQPTCVTTTGKAKPSNPRKTTKDRFYSRCGRRFLAIGKVGYSYSVPENAHMINGGLLSFRTGLFGLSLLDCEVSVSPKTNSFNWHPTMKVGIPIASATTLSIYTGATAEAMSTFNKINEGKENKSEDFFISPLAGISFDFQPFRVMPISLFCEYRHRLYQNGHHIESNVIGDRHGVYTGIQMAIGFGR